jgi:hypothetical protein
MTPRLPKTFCQPDRENPDGRIFYLDVPEANHSANAMARKHKLRPVFKTARMYNRQIPKLPMENIYGVTSFELG